MGATERASKGSVQVRSIHDRIQLRFSYAGKRYYLSLGLRDTVVHRRVAEAKAKTIEHDILFGQFDPTLAKYKAQTALSTVEDAPPPIQQPDLEELWNLWIDNQQEHVSPNTLHKVLAPMTSYVNRLPTHCLSEAVEIQNYCIKHIPKYSCKRFFTKLSACCEWSIKQGLVTSNPFLGMAREIKLTKRNAVDYNIYPFTLEERDLIIEAFRSNQFCPKASNFSHSYYTELVRFLFMTGCRPSEAAALKWKHISRDFKTIHFEEALIETEVGKRVRTGLKTQSTRRFPCNHSLKQLLKEIPSERHPEALVFPSPRGGYVKSIM